MKKIAVCIPCGDGKLSAQTASSLMAEQVCALSEGYGLVLFHTCFNSILPRARNLLVTEFLETDCDYMVFVDADMGWHPGAITKLVKLEEDIVGASGILKTEGTDFPYRVLWKPEDKLQANDKGLVEVAGIGTGFLCLKRSMLENLIATHPELRYHEHSSSTLYSHRLFDFVQEGECYYGEDMWFCKLVAAAGFKIFVDPEIELLHIGAKVFRGCLGDWLRLRFKLQSLGMNEKEVNRAVAKIYNNDNI